MDLPACVLNDPGVEGQEIANVAGIGVGDVDDLLKIHSALVGDLFGIDAGRVEAGAAADLILVDEDQPWKIVADDLAGRAGNTPFDGLPVQGRVLKTIKGGQPLG